MTHNVKLIYLQTIKLPTDYNWYSFDLVITFCMYNNKVQQLCSLDLSQVIYYKYNAMVTNGCVIENKTLYYFEQSMCLYIYIENIIIF